MPNLNLQIADSSIDLAKKFNEDPNTGIQAVKNKCMELGIAEEDDQEEQIVAFFRAQNKILDSQKIKAYLNTRGNDQIAQKFSEYTIDQVGDEDKTTFDNLEALLSSPDQTNIGKFLNQPENNVTAAPEIPTFTTFSLRSYTESVTLEKNGAKVKVQIEHPNMWQRLKNFFGGGGTKPKVRIQPRVNAEGFDIDDNGAVLNTKNSLSLAANISSNFASEFTSKFEPLASASKHLAESVEPSVSAEPALDVATPSLVGQAAAPAPSVADDQSKKDLGLKDEPAATSEGEDTHPEEKAPPVADSGKGEVAEPKLKVAAPEKPTVAAAPEPEPTPQEETPTSAIPRTKPKGKTDVSDIPQMTDLSHVGNYIQQIKELLEQAKKDGQLEEMLQSDPNNKLEDAWLKLQDLFGPFSRYKNAVSVERLAESTYDIEQDGRKEILRLIESGELEQAYQKDHDRLKPTEPTLRPLMSTSYEPQATQEKPQIFHDLSALDEQIKKISAAIADARKDGTLDAMLHDDPEEKLQNALHSLLATYKFIYDQYEDDYQDDPLKSTFATLEGVMDDSDDGPVFNPTKFVELFATGVLSNAYAKDHSYINNIEYPTKQTKSSKPDVTITISSPITNHIQQIKALIEQAKKDGTLDTMLQEDPGEKLGTAWQNLQLLFGPLSRHKNATGITRLVESLHGSNKEGRKEIIKLIEQEELEKAYQKDLQDIAAKAEPSTAPATKPEPDIPPVPPLTTPAASTETPTGATPADLQAAIIKGKTLKPTIATKPQKSSRDDALDAIRQKPKLKKATTAALPAHLFKVTVQDKNKTDSITIPVDISSQKLSLMLRNLSSGEAGAADEHPLRELLAEKIPIALQAERERRQKQQRSPAKKPTKKWATVEIPSSAKPKQTDATQQTPKDTSKSPIGLSPEVNEQISDSSRKNLMASIRQPFTGKKTTKKQSVKKADQQKKPDNEPKKENNGFDFLNALRDKMKNVPQTPDETESDDWDDEETSTPTQTKPKDN